MNPDLVHLLSRVSDDQRVVAATEVALGGVDDALVDLKYEGKEITSEIRDMLLEKCTSGKYVELTLNVRAYDQTPGVRNRNYVRIEEEGMVAFGKTGKGKPFLRDHLQRDSLAVCGEIYECKTEMEGKTSVVREQVRLTAPWAVELALRNLMKSVSISWMATGPVKCSVCNTQILTKCYHWPGDRLSESTDEHGNKKFVWNRAGTIFVEWVYTSAEIVETSPVPVPAVKSARIDGIRASISASLGIVDYGDPINLDPANRELPPPENQNMKTEQEIAALEALNARLTKIVTLSPEQREFFNEQHGDAQTMFLNGNDDLRTSMMKPCYVADDGTKFTNPALGKMAKRMDDDAKASKKRIADMELAAMKGRVQSELSHLPLSVEEGASLLSAIDKIENEEHRTKIMTIITDLDAKQAPKFVRQGGSGGKKPGKIVQTSQSKLDDLVAKHMADHSCDDMTALAAVMETEAGQTLYGEIENEKRDNRIAAQGGGANN